MIFFQKFLPLHNLVYFEWQDRSIVEHVKTSYLPYNIDPLRNEFHQLQVAMVQNPSTVSIHYHVFKEKEA